VYGPDVSNMIQYEKQFLWEVIIYKCVS
jgi:hypothetical protein